VNERRRGKGKRTEGGDHRNWPHQTGFRRGGHDKIKEVPFRLKRGGAGAISGEYLRSPFGDQEKRSLEKD